MSARTHLDDNDQRAYHGGLCPVCRSVRVQIRASVEVEYEVEAVPEAAEIVVVDERLADSGWDDADEAACPACGWHGCVSDLAR